ncbi:hypothetical protein [Endozoicomonas sp. ALD040]|uniref:hypothetical protein n=1 Tax=unclassified Endozoicomonas TaxID=2644528 RepID=UPI003BAF613F
MSNSNHYGYLWLAEIKFFAKKLKTTHPDLGHSQRLDYAAQKLAKLRHYHEAITLHKKYIASLQEDQGSGMAKCKYCGFTYCADIADDLKWHEDRHLNYEKAVKALGYKPEGFVDREDSKEKAYSAIHSAFGLDEQINAALKVFRSHFDRSLERAIDDGYWKEHPSFDEFVAMMDYAPGVISEKAIEVIREKYGRKEGHIPKGGSYWFPSKQG